MNSSEPVGTIRALRRFPVKSMLGEELDAADLTEGARLGASGSRECSPSHDAEVPGKQRA
jgi:hypothetical protein